MEAALAANSLNLGQLVASTRVNPGRIPTNLTPIFAALPLEPALPPLGPAVEGREGAASAGTVPVPDVSGLPARIAVRHLHRYGLRVAQVGIGEEHRPARRVPRGARRHDTSPLRRAAP